ncbi:MAG: cation:proton antiporter [Actinomycetota bacterium]
MAATAALFALAIVGFALISGRVGRWNITMPMVFVALGAVTDATGLVDLDVEIEGVAVIGEITLAVILFGDAVRIDLRALRRDLGLPLRLLAIGLPLAVVLGAGVVSVLLPSLSIWEAALVAAILAPTDAALGQAVVEEESVPIRVRQGLNVESGLNDGLAVPAVLLFMALASGEAETDPGFWGEFVLRQVGLGAIIGLAVGGIGGWAISRAGSRGWIEGIYGQLATVSLAGLALATALTAGANGFIAAFVAGATFGGVVGSEKAESLDEYTEDTGRALAMFAFFLFGNLFVLDALSATSVVIIACALASLTVGRIVPVALSLLGMGAAWPTTLFLGWFGPRGLASILFGLQLLEEDLAGADELFSIIAWTVVASVFLHGATAGWGARRYGRWWAEMSTHEDMDDMPESMPVAPQRIRWRRGPLGPAVSAIIDR